MVLFDISVSSVPNIFHVVEAAAVLRKLTIQFDATKGCKEISKSTTCWKENAQQELIKMILQIKMIFTPAFCAKCCIPIAELLAKKIIKNQIILVQPTLSCILLFVCSSSQSTTGNMLSKTEISKRKPNLGYHCACKHRSSYYSRVVIIIL